MCRETVNDKILSNTENVYFMRSDGLLARDRGSIESAIRCAIVEHTPPLGGVFRLLFHLRFADAFRWGPSDLLDDDLLGKLLDRCWLVPDAEVGDAASLLMALLRWRKKEVLAELEDRRNLIGSWLTNAGPDAASGLAWLVNDTYNDSRSVAKWMCSASDPLPLARRFSQAPVTEWPALAGLVDRMALAGGTVWRRGFQNALDSKLLIEAAGRLSPHDIEYLSFLAKGMAAVDIELAIDLVDTATEAVAQAISQSPSEIFPAIHDLVWFVLGYSPRFLRHRVPNRHQRRIARSIVKRLDVFKIANIFPHASRREWVPLADLLFWIKEVDAELAATLVYNIDMESLDAETITFWPEFPHELKVLVCALAIEPDYEPARTWLFDHANDLARLESIIAIISPEATLTAIRNGHQLDLTLGSGLEWNNGANALVQLAEIDKTTAVEVATANVGGISKGLHLPQADKCKDLVSFMMVIESLAPQVLRSAISAIEPEAVEKNWVERLRGKKVEKQTVANILNIAKDSHGPIRDLAEKLRIQFPSTMH